jgi:hypothetical protein
VAGRFQPVSSHDRGTGTSVRTELLLTILPRTNKSRYPPLHSIESRCHWIFDGSAARESAQCCTIYRNPTSAMNYLFASHRRLQANGSEISKIHIWMSFSSRKSMQCCRPRNVVAEQQAAWHNVRPASNLHAEHSFASGDSLRTPASYLFELSRAVDRRFQVQ